MQQHPHDDQVKGKCVIELGGVTHVHQESTPHVEKWRPPESGTAKLNVDGAYVAENGYTGAGMILRDHLGAVIFAAVRVLPSCTGALKAEFAAI